ncbi:MAG: sulfatase-like hydrolase/transferase, partial [Pseudomonadota bacterium]
PVADAMFDEFHGAEGDYVQLTDAFGRTDVYDQPVEDLWDWKAATDAVNFLATYDGDAPFFAGYGIFRPHADWVVPQEYFDLYPIDGIVLPETPDGDLADIPGWAIDALEVFYTYHDDVLDNDAWAKLVQGYLASISFADAMLGRVLDALESSPHGANTSIVLWSDNGYHLGDKEGWHKFTLWEAAARVPLVIVDPDIEGGQQVETPVALIDLFATVLDIADASPPGDHEGQSLVPLLENPTLERVDPVFTTMYGSISVRTDSYRFTRYEDGSRELYDVIADPEQYDNLAGDPGLADVEAGLLALILDHADQVGIVLGTAGHDALIGTGEADILVGGGGVDTYEGGAGGDTYIIASSDDRVVERPGGGVDTIISRVATFTLPLNVEMAWVVPGVSGLDVQGNNLDNRIMGGRSKTEPDFIRGANGNDEIDGYDGNDRLVGNEGDDILRGGALDDTLHGGAGDDELRGEADNDLLFGNGGADFLVGGAGDDRVFGGTGDDQLIGGIGNDHYDGEDGEDTVNFASLNLAMVVDLAEGTAGSADPAFAFGTQTLANIEVVVAGSEDDTLMGSGAADQLFGLVGDDMLFGRRGADRLFGGPGDDRLVGGDDNDRLVGFDGDDRLNGGSGDDVLSGGEGADIFTVGDGLDRVFGGAGRDMVAFAEASTGVDFDLNADTATEAGNPNRRIAIVEEVEAVSGSVFGDMFTGTSLNDVLFGVGGDDRLYGMFGDDRLIGGDGDDTLRGGPGVDYLEGGSGFDRFVFSRGNADGDVIADLETDATGDLLPDRLLLIGFSASATLTILPTSLIIDDRTMTETITLLDPVDPASVDYLFL